MGVDFEKSAANSNFVGFGDATSLRIAPPVSSLSGGGLSKTDSQVEIFEKSNILFAMTKPLDATFQALADRTRWRILNILRDDETYVGDLVAVLAIPQPSVSRQLAVLRAAGLVGTRKVGAWVFYRTATSASPFRRHILASLVDLEAEDDVFTRDREQARRLREKDGCCPTATSSARNQRCGGRQGTTESIG